MAPDLSSIHCDDKTGDETMIKQDSKDEPDSFADEMGELGFNDIKIPN